MADTLFADEMVVLLAVKLVQPGQLRDVTEGVIRLIPDLEPQPSLKQGVSRIIGDLREQDLICLYAGSRYMLTGKGQSYVEASGIKAKIDARRFFLLKETRKRNQWARSDARKRPL